ncbi:hypothetical protein ACSSS7_002522 [Eimeria intestinalis]
MSAILQAAQDESDSTTRCSMLGEEAEDESFGGRIDRTNDEGIVHGVALKFAQADLGLVLEKLDYREKGGYSRVLVEFFPLEEKEYRRGEQHRIHAFVYMGLPCNSNFYCFPDSPLSRSHDKESSQTANDSEQQESLEGLSGFRTPAVENTEYSCSQRRAAMMCCRQTSTALLCHSCPDDATHAAKMILRARGVSGPNTEYLFRLADFLRSIGQLDEHVFSLETRVKQLMGRQVNHELYMTEMTELTDLN